MGLIPPLTGLYTGSDNDSTRLCAIGTLPEAHLKKSPWVTGMTADNCG